MDAIETLGLVWHPREDPRRRVLDGVTMRIRRGSVTALLGRNGSGKTTLLRVLATLLSPRAGIARVAGKDVAAAPLAVRAAIGLLTEEAGLPDRAAPLWHLRFHALLRGWSWEASAREARRTLASLGIEDAARQPMALLSRGIRQRVALGRALVCDPEVLLLDEPDATLDDEIAGIVRALLRRRTAAGRTVLLATHDPVWAGGFCDQALTLDGGRIATGETP
jgi:ABC-type multidrug transport system ATPase subunit